MKYDVSNGTLFVAIKSNKLLLASWVHFRSVGLLHLEQPQPLSDLALRSFWRVKGAEVSEQVPAQVPAQKLALREQQRSLQEACEQAGWSSSSSASKAWCLRIADSKSS